MKPPPHATTFEKIWYWAYLAFCAAVFLFLILPIVVIVPLSFNAEPYFTFSREMLSLDPAGYSLRWYERLLTFGMTAPDAARDTAWWLDAWANSQWLHAAKNSFLIGIASTLVAPTLGTLAALGLSRPEMPFRRAVMALLISPMIVPMIISATGLFFFYSKAGLAHTYIGIVLAHAMLGIPFVIITVTATLVGFDRSLIHAAASLGATPVETFRKVILPLAMPGVLAGSMLVFIPSVGDFINADYLGSTQTTMIGNVIQKQFLVVKDYPAAAALSLVLMLIILGGVLLYTRALGTEDLV